MPKDNWHSLSQQKLLKQLKTNPQNGLRFEDAVKRFRKLGPNILPQEDSATRLKILINQFKSPLIYILLIAAVISIILLEFVDAAVIIAAVIINTIVGFIQENKANQALSTLKQAIVYKCKVIRDGIEHEIDSKNLVVGDLIVLQEGDRIPADARLLEAHNLQVVEAVLTGESMPSNKEAKVLKQSTPLPDRENMVYMGTTVVRGSARAVVTATGTDTQIGVISQLIKSTPEEKTPLQENLAKFSKILGIIVGAICVIILILGILVGREPFEMFLAAVAIAVAAIPEGLLVSVTIILAIGMQRILKKRAIIRKLIATETLGSVSVICTDKTGTLTEGKMKVVEIKAPGHRKNISLKKFQGLSTNIDYKELLEVLKIGILCNNAVIETKNNDPESSILIGEPTEKALLSIASQFGIEQKKLLKSNPRIDEISFDRKRKYMATLHQTKNSSHTIYIKGAPEKLLSLAGSVFYNKNIIKLDSRIKKQIINQYTALTRNGLRVLAVGYKKTKKSQITDKDLNGLIFVGLIGIKDPLRKEAKEAIYVARSAGINPIIVTGDHKLTAKNIAQEIGLEVKDENILLGEELDKIDDKQFLKIVKKIRLYARVEPKHKLRIIDAWQKLSQVVAMTGDGVNDAPAIKKADIGIALGSGTDVSQETSDMILLDDNFKTIVTAIQQGRIIFDNIRKVIVYLLSDSFSEMILISASLIIGLPLPILPAQILWINLITDGFPNVALTVEPGEKDIMKNPPRPKREPILDTEMKVLIFIIGIFTDLILLGLFYFLLQKFGNTEIDYIRTIIFAVLGLDSLFYVFSCRSLRRPIWRINPFTNHYLLMAVGSGIIIQLIAIYIPFFQNIFHTVSLGFYEWMIIVALCIIEIIAIETVKYAFIVKKEYVASR